MERSKSVGRRTLLGICRAHTVKTSPQRGTAGGLTGGQKIWLPWASGCAGEWRGSSNRHHAKWAVGLCCRNGLRRAPFFIIGGSKGLAGGRVKARTLAGLGKAVGTLRRMLSGQSSWVCDGCAIMT